MKRKKEDVLLHDQIWFKIRYYQKVHKLPNDILAAYLGVTERTLLEYDKHAENVTLGKIEKFLISENLELNELLNL